MDDPKIVFGQVLRDLLTKNDMTAKQLSSLIKVSESAVSDWIKEKSVPSDVNAIMRCARVFGVTLHFMVYGEDELNEEGRAIKGKFDEIIAGQFELVLRPLKK